MLQTLTRFRVSDFWYWQLQVCDNWDYCQRANSRKNCKQTKIFPRNKQLGRHFPAIFVTAFMRFLIDLKVFCFDPVARFSYQVATVVCKKNRLPAFNTFLRHLWNCRANRSNLIGSSDDNIESNSFRVSCDEFSFLVVDMFRASFAHAICWQYYQRFE